MSVAARIAFPAPTRDASAMRSVMDPSFSDFSIAAISFADVLLRLILY